MLEVSLCSAALQGCAPTCKIDACAKCKQEFRVVVTFVPLDGERELFGVHYSTGHNEAEAVRSFRGGSSNHKIVGFLKSKYSKGFVEYVATPK